MKAGEYCNDDLSNVFRLGTSLFVIDPPYSTIKVSRPLADNTLMSDYEYTAYLESFKNKENKQPEDFVKELSNEQIHVNDQFIKIMERMEGEADELTIKTSKKNADSYVSFVDKITTE